jgi:AcrR family transcriptional regulator
MQRMNRETRAAQLLDVVEALTLKEGAGAVTMERIAELAGVAKPVVYRHFGNASAALLAVLERRWAAIDPDLDAIFRGGPDFEGGVRRGVERYLGELAADRYLIRKLLATAMDDPVVARAFRARLDRRGRDLAAILARDLEVEPNTAVTLATFCIGALSRLGDKVHEAPESARAQADRFARFITGGLRAAAGGEA